MLTHLTSYELIVLAVILATLMHKAQTSLLLSALFNFIGTFFHELMHFLIALLFNAKPTGFTLLPRKENGSYIYGQVSCKNIKWYNSFPVALAPLLLMPISYFLFQNFYRFYPKSPTLLSDILLTATAVVILFNALPSLQDIRVATHSFVGLVFYSVTIGVIITYLINSGVLL